MPVVNRVICVANQKGGVGKTTTAINLAANLTCGNQNVLLIDLDPQSNATSGLGQSPQRKHPLLSGESIRDQVIQTASRVDLLPSCTDISDYQTLEEEHQLQEVKSYLKLLCASYDTVIFDCPPSLGELTHLALSTSTEVLIPVQCEYFALEGLSQLIENLKDYLAAPNPTLEFGGVLLTMSDASLDLSQEVEAEVRDFFGDVVYQTVIPRDAVVAEAPSHGQPLIEYAPRSRGTRAYIELCMEVCDCG